MYTRYIERHGGWKMEVMSLSDGTLGGFKEAIFKVSGGDGAFGDLRFESGVHRVQRVPATEAQGRIHTSAAPSRCCPRPTRWMSDRGQGSPHRRLPLLRPRRPEREHHRLGRAHHALAVGTRGQPAGPEVAAAEQAQGDGVLRSRLLDLKVAEQEAERSRMRKSQVSTGDRSAKIRTYNYPQSRVTDHRIGYTTHDLAGIMEGKLDELMEALRLADIEEFSPGRTRD
jgi:peptide chain release factor 1